MTIRTSSILKAFFLTGKVPTEANYADLIDTLFSMGDWATLLNKPATFPPAAHQHPGGDINSAVANANAVPWGGITGKPGSFTPSAHTHAGGDIISAVANATSASQLAGIAAANYLQKLSAGRPGLDRIYRYDADDGWFMHGDYDGSRFNLTWNNGASVLQTRVNYSDSSGWSSDGGSTAHTIVPAQISDWDGRARNVGVYDYNVTTYGCPSGCQGVLVRFLARWAAAGEGNCLGVRDTANRDFGSCRSQAAGIADDATFCIMRPNGDNVIRMQVWGANATAAWAQITGYIR